jgi:hypothetical protein
MMPVAVVLVPVSTRREAEENGIGSGRYGTQQHRDGDARSQNHALWPIY